MRVLPAQVQGFAANLMRYRDTVSDPDLTHCPLIFCKGTEVPLQAALRQCVQMLSAAPRWSINERGLHLGHQPAPAQGTVPPPPGLSAEDLPVKDFDTWSLASTADEGPPSPAPGYVPVVSKHCGSSYHPELLQGPRRELALDASTFASTGSAASTMSLASIESTMSAASESLRCDVVLQSPAYAVASLKVTDLLMQLRQAGAF